MARIAFTATEKAILCAISAKVQTQHFFVLYIVLNYRPISGPSLILAFFATTYVFLVNTVTNTIQSHEKDRVKLSN